MFKYRYFEQRGLAPSSATQVSPLLIAFSLSPREAPPPPPVRVDLPAVSDFWEKGKHLKDEGVVWIGGGI